LEFVELGSELPVLLFQEDGCEALIGVGGGVVRGSESSAVRAVHFREAVAGAFKFVEF
jgi:hypothetical protein